jgi:hypothetical protein
MARIVFNTWMVQYPLGGVLSYFLQWIIGCRRLGHDVYVVEKAPYSNGIFDPWDGLWGDDHAYGLATVRWLLGKFGLEDRHCFVDRAGIYHGMERTDIERIFATADLFFDIKGPGYDWLEEASRTPLTAVLDGEPASNQIWLASILRDGGEIPKYDHYFTVGLNIGTTSTAPTAGVVWKPTLVPILTELFPIAPPRRTAPFTTVMSWQSAPELTFDGKIYGQKDVEFESFIGLPKMTSSRMEVAVSGRNTPFDRLRENGWQLRDPFSATIGFETYVHYIVASKGEFSVARNVFAATNSGWFADRTAAYLASGRPAVVQDTGFSEHLPCGQGLFAVRTVEEAAAAIEAIDCNYSRHSKAARELADELLAPERVITNVMSQLGI